MPSATKQLLGWVHTLHIYNSLKACKGTVFFLPLSLNKTFATLAQVEQCGGTLPNPELYVIVNGKPTKSKVVWCSLVDVNHVKQGLLLRVYGSRVWSV